MRKKAIRAKREARMGDEPGEAESAQRHASKHFKHPFSSDIQPIAASSD